MISCFAVIEVAPGSSHLARRMPRKVGPFMLPVYVTLKDGEVDELHITTEYEIHVETRGDTGAASICIKEKAAP